MLALSPGELAAILTGLGGLVVAISGLAVAISKRRRNDADVASIATQTALSLIQPLRAQVAALEEEVATLQAQVARFRRGVRLLCGQVRELGAVPVWEPDEADDE